MAKIEIDLSCDDPGAFLLRADHVLTMDDANTVWTDGAVHVNARGQILAVGPAEAILASAPGLPVKRLRNRLLMPGLVNTHAHSGLLRGTAEGLPVWEWLQRFIDPMHRVLTPHEAELASRLCYAEALLSGTTTIVDMWRHMDGSARAAADLGIRAVLVPYAAEHPDHDYFETLATNKELIQQWHGGAEGRIHVWVGLEHMFYATPDGWGQAMDLAQNYGVGFHTHSNESRFDVEETERRFGERPIQALLRHGLLEAPRTLLAHCVWLSQEEVEILAEKGIGVAHNPTSNMKLASGAAPIKDLLKAGVTVGLGTDGEKENNNLDMLEEMKIASLLGKLRESDAAALDAWTLCRMATREGGKALGLESQIGSLEKGKQADIIALRTDTPRMTPLLSGASGNLHSNIVHAAQGGDVAMTMVGGRILVEDGRLLVADLQDLICQVNESVPDLLARRTAWLRAHDAMNELQRSATEVASQTTLS